MPTVPIALLDNSGLVVQGSTLRGKGKSGGEAAPRFSLPQGIPFNPYPQPPVAPLAGGSAMLEPAPRLPHPQAVPPLGKRGWAAQAMRRWQAPCCAGHVGGGRAFLPPLS